MFNAIFMLGNEDARVQNQHVECRGSITKFRGTYNDEFEALALQSTLLYVFEFKSAINKVNGDRSVSVTRLK